MVTNILLTICALLLGFIAHRMIGWRVSEDARAESMVRWLNESLAHHRELVKRVAQSARDRDATRKGQHDLVLDHLIEAIQQMLAAGGECRATAAECQKLLTSLNSFCASLDQNVVETRDNVRNLSTSLVRPEQRAFPVGDSPYTRRVAADGTRGGAPRPHPLSGMAERIAHSEDTVG